MILGAVTPSFDKPTVEWLALAPEIALVGGAVLVVLLRSLLRRRPAALFAAVVTSFAAALAAGGTLAWQWFHVRSHGAMTTFVVHAFGNATDRFSGMMRVDTFAVFLGILVVVALFLSLLLALAYLRREGLETPEFLALLLFSAAGMLVMTSANNLIVVFVSLELLSIPLYVLAAFDRRRLASQEAGIKYFVLGAFSSAIFLYGVALVYGATGTTSLTGIAEFLSAHTVFDDGVVYVRDGEIIAVQSSSAEAPNDFLSAPISTKGTIYPGLIELHNHLSYNALPLWSPVPRLFEHRGQWPEHPDYRKLISGPMTVVGEYRDTQGQPALLAPLVRYVECKCLLGGVTTSQGIMLNSNAGIQRFYRGILRNVEQTDDPDLSEAQGRIADVDAKSARSFLTRLTKEDSCFLLHLSEGVTKAHFAGISMGGSLAQHFAGTYPDMVPPAKRAACWAGSRK